MRVPARHKMPLTGLGSTGVEAGPMEMGSGKAPALSASSCPSSVSSWLGRELELRGIDAVIYTRYILSILQQDDLQVDLQDADFFPHFKKSHVGGAKAVTPSSCVVGGVGASDKGSKSKGRGKKADSVKRRSVEMDSEKLKKSAAVECLLSVTDEDSGIETLVDELYLKLKEQKAKSTAAAEAPEQAATGTSDNYESSDSVISTSPEDPAERYYAAFPALSEKTDEFKPKVTGTAKDAKWAQMAKKSPTPALDSSSTQPKSGSGSDMEEFPDTIQDFEKLERDLALKKKKVPTATLR